MSDVDDLQNAPDDFAFLGLNREFRIDPVRLDDAFARVSNQIAAAGGDRAAELRDRLKDARDRLADPVHRARYLLELLAGQGEPEAGEMPETLKGFEQQVASAKDPDSVRAARGGLLAERQSRLDHIATIFSFPRNVPNPASQWSRDSVIRMDLRAIDIIDRLLGQLDGRGQ